LPRFVRRQWADHFDSVGIRYAFFSALNASALQEAAALAEQQALLAEEAALENASDSDEDESSEEELEVVPQPRGHKEQKEVEKEAIDLERDEQREQEGYEERTRVLSVLELEQLFESEAPNLNGAFSVATYNCRVHRLTSLAPVTQIS
jgi:large subunit GTPase 1